MEWLPRFRGGAMLVASVQTFLTLTAPAVDFGLRARGFRVEYRTVGARGRQASVRIIYPPCAPRGVFFDVHGGAWVVGIPAQNDSFTTAIARECGLIVVAPRYRLLRPGSIPIDRCIDDCETVAVWLLESNEPNLKRGPVFMSGDSAGAHLAACTLLRLRDGASQFPRIAGAVLRYGVYDFTGTPSVRAGAKTLVLDGPGLHRGLTALTPGLSDAERRAPGLSPLYADLHDLPPALFLAGEADVLRDDSILFSERWANAGNAAELALVPNAPHAFDRLPTRVAKKTAAHIQAWITSRISAEPSQLVFATAAT
jgi:acetyl esterase/lipase